MGVIKEQLTLADAFSATFNRFNTLGERAVQTAERLEKSTRDALSQSASASTEGFQALTAEAQKTNEILGQILEKQKKTKEETKKTKTAADAWRSAVKGVGAAMATIGAKRLIQDFLQAADTSAQISARISAVNDGLQSNARLQEMIYASAQRSHSAYNDTANLVARIGQNAKDVFSNNREMIQFAENLNKSFKIGGASQMEQASATLQLTQAMASGVLRGEEFNSVMEAAPSVIQRIAKYMGVTVGEMRNLAAEGKITANVVKSAMLGATDDIAQEFQNIPMTLSDAITMGKNHIQRSLGDAFSGWNKLLNSTEGQRAISNMITLFTALANAGVMAFSLIANAGIWAADNMNLILPVLAGIGVAFAFMKAQAIAAAAASVGGAVAQAAAWALTHWYIILIVAAVAGAILLAQQMGVTFEQAGAVAGAAFGFTYAVGYNAVASLWNLLATFAEFFANVWNDTLGSVVRLFRGVFDSILSIVETVASAIDALLGTSLSGAVSGFRSKLSGWVDDKFGESAVKIKRMANLDVGASMDKWSNAGGNLGKKIDNLSFSMDDLTGKFSGVGSGFDASAFGAGNDIGNVGKVGKVGKIDGDVKLSDEDLKLYRDLAERRYMNRIELKTLAPQISVMLPAGSGGGLKPEDVANYIKKMLIERMNSGAEVSHA